MWVLLSNEMNFGGRFQYPVLAIGALSWYPLFMAMKNELCVPQFQSLSRTHKFTALVVGGAILSAVFTLQAVMSARGTYARDGRYEVAMVLHTYAGRGYTIATTEAGLLPLYSGWRAVDTWGLNDQWIEHNGSVTEEYIQQNTPDIIMVHEKPAPGQSSAPSGLEESDASWDRLWAHQVLVLKDYAKLHNFTLAAAFGVTPGDTHQYYVRPDLPDHDEIVNRIRSVNYTWYATGAKCMNYASFPGE
jgi:hypothetical protein